jgi:hypothetical protein
MSMSTLPRSSRTTGRQVDALDGESAAEGIDDLPMARRGREHTAPEGADPRDDDQWHLVADRRRDRLAPDELGSGPLDGDAIGLLAVTVEGLERGDLPRLGERQLPTLRSRRRRAPPREPPQMPPGGSRTPPTR